MARLTRPSGIAIAAVAAAILVPLALVQPYAGTPAPDRFEQAPLPAPPVPPPLRAAFAHPLFAAPVIESAPPADAPQLIGIVGRLGRDAVALVRGSDGTRTLAPGDSVDGWQLRSLAIDAAYFTRGGQSARVAVPGNDDQR